jgi:hypothetical protein
MKVPRVGIEPTIPREKLILGDVRRRDRKTVQAEAASIPEPSGKTRSVHTPKLLGGVHLYSRRTATSG